MELPNDSIVSLLSSDGYLLTKSDLLSIRILPNFVQHIIPFNSESILLNSHFGSKVLNQVS